MTLFLVIILIRSYMVFYLIRKLFIWLGIDIIDFKLHLIYKNIHKNLRKYKILKTFFKRLNKVFVSKQEKNKMAFLQFLF